MTQTQLETRHLQTCGECRSGRFCSIWFAISDRIERPPLPKNRLHLAAKIAVGLAVGLWRAHGIIDYAGVEMLAVVCFSDFCLVSIVGGAHLLHLIRRRQWAS